MKSAIEMRHIATNAIKENLTSDQITQLNLIQEKINKEALKGKLSCDIFEEDELYKVFHDFFIRNVLISLGYKVQIREISNIECESTKYILVFW
jgi:hypothetical protein